MLVKIAACALTLAGAAFAKAPDAERFKVKRLPNQPLDYYPMMHAGVLEIEKDKSLFFWHVAADHEEGKNNTIIWLNGGPGCSSEDGALIEIGPFSAQKPAVLETNPSRWNSFANVLFIDQPIGVGFSFGTPYEKNMWQISNSFVKFLKKWFETFPEYQNNKLYIAGESFAGIYIPYFAKLLLETSNEAIPPLEGIIIGNGWLDPKTQYPAQIDFAKKFDLLKNASKPCVTELRKFHKQCDSKLKKKINSIQIDVCEDMFVALLDATRKSKHGEADTCINYYDIRLTDSYPGCGANWPSTLPYASAYLRKDDVLDALNTNKSATPHWVECSGEVQRQLNLDNSPPSVDFLPEIIDKIRVLLFNGDQDLICNYMGVEKMIHGLKWRGETGFGSKAKLEKWFYNGEVHGLYNTRDNLQYVRVFGASHMVPVDKPLPALDLINRFMNVDVNLYSSSQRTYLQAVQKMADKPPVMVREYDYSFKICFLRIAIVLFLVTFVSFLFSLFMYYMKKVTKPSEYEQIKQDKFIEHSFAPRRDSTKFTLDDYEEEHHDEMERKSQHS